MATTKSTSSRAKSSAKAAAPAAAPAEHSHADLLAKIDSLESQVKALSAELSAVKVTCADQQVQPAPAAASAEDPRVGPLIKKLNQLARHLRGARTPMPKF